MKVTIIRVILTLLIIYAVYTETGIFTAITITLIFIETEVSAYAHRKNGGLK